MSETPSLISITAPLQDGPNGYSYRQYDDCVIIYAPAGSQECVHIRTTDPDAGVYWCGRHSQLHHQLIQMLSGELPEVNFLVSLKTDPIPEYLTFSLDYALTDRQFSDGIYNDEGSVSFYHKYTYKGVPIIRLLVSADQSTVMGEVETEELVSDNLTDLVHVVKSWMMDQFSGIEGPYLPTEG